MTISLLRPLVGLEYCSGDRTDVRILHLTRFDDDSVRIPSKLRLLQSLLRQHAIAVNGKENRRFSGKKVIELVVLRWLWLN